MIRIGVISDTHALLRPEAVAALAGCGHIVHAGDIGAPAVLDGLRQIAPVTAVRGNNDHGAWAAALPQRVTVVLGGAPIHIVHDLHELRIDPVAKGLAAIISGHSHRPTIERRNGVLFLNPGSAGPRRFTLPIALALLEIGGGAVAARLVMLDTANRRSVRA